MPYETAAEAQGVTWPRARSSLPSRRLSIVFLDFSAPAPSGSGWTLAGRGARKVPVATGASDTVRSPFTPEAHCGFFISQSAHTYAPGTSVSSERRGPQSPYKPVAASLRSCLTLFSGRDCSSRSTASDSADAILEDSDSLTLAPGRKAQ
jgi:hypothetical protein